MTEQQIRDKAPSGATHYMLSTLNLEVTGITYFKFNDGKYLSIFHIISPDMRQLFVMV